MIREYLAISILSNRGIKQVKKQGVVEQSEIDQRVIEQGVL